MNIVPIRDRVVARVLPSQDRSEGGIIIPDGAGAELSKAEVVSVGSGALTSDGSSVPMEIKVGHTILYKKGTGIEIPDSDKSVILRESEILGVLQ